MTKPGLSVRVDFGPRRLGPGKVALLEAIAQEGSISGAARHLTMSYKRAWDLVDDLNQTFGTPVIATAAGGARGGGASLTPMGEEIVARYRAIERDAQKAAKLHLSALARKIVPQAAS